eukprot:GHVP01059416.1.p1 GENE.GHVP01059416.1~~GHVP01059416.1.p1  ORF type:complete len:423 (-),score=69.61 GHVP01059416.1:293-1561(-)
MRTWQEQLRKTIDDKMLFNIASSSEGMYGENTEKSMRRLLDILADRFLLDEKNSIFLDLGSGRGLPSFVAVSHGKVLASLGVEFDLVSFQLSVSHLLKWLNYLNQEGQTTRPNGGVIPSIAFLHKDASQLSAFDPVTHIFSFDLAMPPNLINSFVQSFNMSKDTLVYVSFKKDLHKYHIQASMVEKVFMSMKGSRESHYAYIYIRTSELSKFPDLDLRLRNPSSSQLRTISLVEEEFPESKELLEMNFNQYVCHVCGNFTCVPLLWSHFGSEKLRRKDAYIEESTTSTVAQEEEDIIFKTLVEPKSSTRDDLTELFELACLSVERVQTCFQKQSKSWLCQRPSRNRRDSNPPKNKLPTLYQIRKIHSQEIKIKKLLTQMGCWCPTAKSAKKGKSCSKKSIVSISKDSLQKVRFSIEESMRDV